MFCRPNQWEAAKFPRELFHDSNSTGGRVLMHTKVRPSCNKTQHHCNVLQMIIATLRRTSPLASSSKPGSKAQSTHPTSSDKGKSKVIVISDSETESESDAPAPEIQKEPIGWVYVGSHNFTPSAWGTISGSGFNPTLNVSFVLTHNTALPDTGLVFVADTIGRQLRAWDSLSALRRPRCEASVMLQATSEGICDG